MSASPLVHILTDGKSGNRAQALGLAQCIVGDYDECIIESVVSAPTATTLMPLSWASKTRWYKMDAAQRADIVICCGNRAQPAALALKKRDDAFVVCIQKPRSDAHKFDAIIAPYHDYPQSTTHANILLTLGSVGPVKKMINHTTKFSHIATPRAGVLIGGDNRAFYLTRQVFEQLAQTLPQTIINGILITTSRRTNDDIKTVLAKLFKDKNCFVDDGDGDDNPYFDILAAADWLLVTGDSVNMLSEACTMGKPVYIIDLPLRSRRAAQKFNDFHQMLITKKLARRWDGVIDHWTPPPFNETARAAEFILSRYRRHQRQG